MPLPPKALLLIGQKMKDQGLASSKSDISPEEDKDDESSESDAHQEHLEEAAADLIKAIKAGDAKGVADCFQEMSECCDAMSHEDGEDESEY